MFAFKSVIKDMKNNEDLSLCSIPFLFSAIAAAVSSYSYSHLIPQPPPLPPIPPLPPLYHYFTDRDYEVSVDGTVDNWY